MLNFRNTNIAFTALAIFCIAGYIQHGVTAYVFLLLFFAYSLVLFYGCYYIGSGFFMPVICKAQTTKKVIALSFDDGPDATNTPKVLQILQQEGVTAAFFCIGNRVAGNEAILKQVCSEGHIIGNHSFSHHFWFDMFTAKQMLADMDLAGNTIYGAVGLTPKLFRPPYGVMTPNLKKAIISGGYTPIGWNIRSMDTVIKDPQKLLDKVTNNLRPGAVILFHDTSHTTLAILPAFIQHAKANGYEIVRLDNMLNLQAYA